MRMKSNRTKASEPITVTLFDGCGAFEMTLTQAALHIKENGLVFCPSSGEWK